MSAGDLPSRRWRSQADIGWMLGKLTLQKVISPSTIFLAQRTTKTYYIWQPKIGVTNTIHYGSCSLLIQSCVQLGSCRSVLARAWRASLRKRHPPQASVEQENEHDALQRCTLCERRLGPKGALESLAGSDGTGTALSSGSGENKTWTHNTRNICQLFLSGNEVIMPRSQKFTQHLCKIL